MTNVSEQKINSDIANNNASDSKAALGKDIRTKWDKFSEIEVGAMKSEDDLVTQLVAKYSLDKTLAQTEAKAVIKGRAF